MAPELLTPTAETNWVGGVPQKSFDSPFPRTSQTRFVFIEEQAAAKNTSKCKLNFVALSTAQAVGGMHK